MVIWYSRRSRRSLKWFKQKWKRFGPDGKIRGDCARGSSSEGKPNVYSKHIQSNEDQEVLDVSVEKILTKIEVERLRT